MDTMKYDPKKHQRRSIRLADYDYTQAGAYFVTICAEGHLRLFGNVSDEVSLDRIRQYIGDNPASWMLDRENPEAEGYGRREEKEPS